MASSFLISVAFFVMKKNGHALPFAHSILYSVAFTTVCWLLTAFLATSTNEDVLAAFYRKVHPAGPGWRKIRVAAGISEAEAALHGDHMGKATLGWISGCLLIWSSLFAIGNFLYARWTYAFALLALFIVSGLVLLYVIRTLWSGKAGSTSGPALESKTSAPGLIPEEP